MLRFPLHQNDPVPARQALAHQARRHDAADAATENKHGLAFAHRIHLRLIIVLA